MPRPIENILALLPGAKRVANNKQGREQWEAKCPAHEDQHASLCISAGEDDRVLLLCQAGCLLPEIRTALGVPMSALFPPVENRRHISEHRSRIVALYDYVDAHGVLLYQVVRFDPKDFRQRRPDPDNPQGWTWNLGETPRVLYRLPALLAADPMQPVLIVEGEKDCDNLVSLGFVATCNPGGAGKWAKLSDDTALYGRRLVILPDRDKPGQSHAEDVATRLAGKAASIKICALPGAGKDASDWIKAGGTADQLRALIATAAEFDPASTPPQAPAEAERLRIQLGTDEFRVIGETIAALKTDPTIFCRGGLLVRVVRQEQATDAEGVRRAMGTATIGILPQPNLRERMTRLADFWKHTAKGEEVDAHPPQWLVAGVDARGEWPGLRSLVSVSDAPVLQPHGATFQTPGYDVVTRVLYDPVAVFPAISPEITQDDAHGAAAQLLDLLCDFRFENEEHRAAWLAAFLTPLARYAFEGPSPLFLIDANVRGAGKTLLAQMIGRILLGREMPVSSYNADPEELRKKITSIALAGDRLILLDNLTGTFGNDVLDRALTTTRWQDRILGKSEVVDLPLTPCWYATGNNVQVAADTTRRCIHIRLDVLSENPEERSGFKYPNILGHVLDHRGELLAAGLTILSAYIKAGKPKHGLKPYGSFEGWSDLVREAVVWCGLPDPCKTREALAQSSDTSIDTLGQIIHAWQTYDTANRGMVISELLAYLYPPERMYTPTLPEAVAMRAALENLTGAMPGRSPTPRQVGNRLKSYRRRVHRGTYIDVDGGPKGENGVRWRLFQVSG